MRKQLLLTATALVASLGLASAQSAGGQTEPGAAGSSAGSRTSQTSQGAGEANGTRGQSGRSAQGQSETQGKREAGEARSQSQRDQDDGQGRREKTEKSGQTQGKSGDGEVGRGGERAQQGKDKAKTTGQASDRGQSSKNSDEPQRKQSEERAQRGKDKAETTGQGKDQAESGQSRDDDRRRNAEPGGPKARGEERQPDETAGPRQPTSQNQKGAEAPEAQPRSQSHSRSDRQNGRAERQGEERRRGESETPASTGSASSGAARTEAQGVSLNAEQETRVRETVLSRRDALRHDRVDFSINVGTAVPTHVEMAEVPSTLVEIHPEWRDHSYFVIEDDIVIVDRNRQITAVIPSGSSRADVGSSSSGRIKGEVGRPSPRGEADEVVALELGSGEIREVQLLLIRQGFLDGEADGVIGPRTRNALIEFQRDRGLSATGSIDRRTVETMDLSGKINVRRQERESSRTGTEGARESGDPEAKPGSQASGQSGARRGGDQSTTGQTSPVADTERGRSPSSMGRDGDRGPSRSTGPGAETGASGPQPNRSERRGGESDRPSAAQGSGK